MQSFRQDSFPVIFFNQDTIDLGRIKHGDVIQFHVPFANVGQADLNIDLATACKCTDIDWPHVGVPPGYSSKIFVEFDSTGFDGEVIKVVDIIANTELIVTEFRFKVFVENNSD